MKKDFRLLDLFLTFMKIGALTFGGGYAMMPVMRKEVVEKKNWANDDDILKILVISETTPGVLAVNSATYIGYKIAGLKGSLLATLGVVIPSLVIISLISLFITQFKELTLVSYAFYGIKAGVAVLITRAAFKLSKKVKFGIFALVIWISAVLFTLIFNINPIITLFLAGVIGFIYGTYFQIKGAKS
jgi:chromate transporter